MCICNHTYTKDDVSSRYHKSHGHLQSHTDSSGTLCLEPFFFSSYHFFILCTLYLCDLLTDWKFDLKSNKNKDPGCYFSLWEHLFYSIILNDLWAGCHYTGITKSLSFSVKIVYIIHTTLWNNDLWVVTCPISYCGIKVHLEVIYSCLISLHGFDLLPDHGFISKICSFWPSFNLNERLPFVSLYVSQVCVCMCTCMFFHILSLHSLSFLAPPCYFSAIEIKVMTGQGKRMFFQ